MILVTGGTGFIGSHTVRALMDAGESCVLLQRRAVELPADLAGATVELADVTDPEALRAVGRRYPITGVVHLAGSMPWPLDDGADPVEATRTALGGLLTIVAAARDWGVHRLGIASTIGVYGGVVADGPLREDAPLPMTSDHVIPTFKKIGELLAGHLAGATELDIVHYRISGTWGPRGHDDPFFAGPALVHAAARGTAPDLSGLAAPAHADDALDLCYVTDTGRAIAALQLADRLDDDTFNVASGRVTSNADIAAAIRTVVPDARVDLPPGGNRWQPLDITRLTRQTGYTPRYDTERAVAEYVEWLRAGHER